MSGLAIQCETIGSFATARARGLTDDERMFIAEKFEAGVGLQNICRMVGKHVDEVKKCLPLHLVAETIRLRDELEAMRSQIERVGSPSLGALDVDDPSVMTRWKTALKTRPASIRILWRLMAEPDVTIPHEKLMRALQSDRNPDPTILNVYLSLLRKALKGAGLDPAMIENDWGAGFRLSSASVAAIHERIGK